MNRILHNDIWFDPIASNALYESEYENIIIQYANLLFPRFKMIRFRELIESEYGASRPDFILLHNDYKIWFFVEVEMIHHDFENHVYPQIINLYNGVIDDTYINAIIRNAPDLDILRLNDLIARTSPAVLVILNKHEHEWEKALLRIGIYVCTIEIYRSDRNHTIFQISGLIPDMDSCIISYCYVDKILPRHLIIESPAALPVPPGQSIKLYDESGVSLWTRIDIKNKTWLRCDRSILLNKNTKYAIMSSVDYKFTLVSVNNKIVNRRLL